MRLVSQDGLVDMPYDKISLFIDNWKDTGFVKSVIFACGNGNTMNLAEYNDEDEAKAVLKRVRESYISKKTYFQFPPKEIREREDNPDVKQ